MSDLKMQNDNNRTATEILNAATSNRTRSIIAGSLIVWMICLMIICVTSFFAANAVFADDYNGADAHSPSMGAGTGEEPIADESTTKDYVSTENTYAVSEPNDDTGVALSENMQSDDTADRQSALVSDDDDSDDEEAAGAVTEGNDADTDGSGVAGIVGTVRGLWDNLKGIMSGLLAGVPAIAVVAFAALFAAMLIVLLTIRKAKTRRRREVYIPRH